MNTVNLNTNLSYTDLDKLSEAQLSFAVRTALNETTLDLSDKVTGRLFIARRAAVAAHRVQKSPIELLQHGFYSFEQWLGRLMGFNTAGGFGRMATKLAMVTPVLALAIGVYLIDDSYTQKDVMATAEIDAKILASDVPPAALLDKGFLHYVQVGE